MEPVTNLSSQPRRMKSESICRRAAVLMLLAGASCVSAQPVPADHSAHLHPATALASTAIADQVQDLKAKVAQLDEAIRRANPAAVGMSPATAAPGGSGMGGGQASAMGGMAPMPPAAAPPAMAGMGGGQSNSGNMGGMMKEMGSMMQMMGGMMDGMKPGGPPTGGMKPGGAGMGMGGMKMDAGEMGGMKMGGAGMPPGGGMPGMAGGQPPQRGGPSGGAMAGMAGMEKMDGMMGMAPGGGGMGGMAGTGPMTAALPGFPGASHLYHIGGTGFFLDHAEHISLTIQQQAALNTVKEKALLAKAANQRKVDTAEQELWAMTALDQPDANKIEAKILEVEKLRGDERLDFIRAVGEAAKLLTDGQRQSLLGFQPPQPATAPAGAMAPM